MLIVDFVTELGFTSKHGFQGWAFSFSDGNKF
jgi:hypothetical protein